jgi:hypothetical protein
LKDLNMDNYDEEDEEGVFLLIHIPNYVFWARLNIRDYLLA